MARKTRRVAKTKPMEIQHHHLLLRMELEHCPGPQDKANCREFVQRIIRDIHMKPLATPHIYYVKVPHYNEGLTAMAPIETSHIAFHFWSAPDKAILKNPMANCLLQFDIYTCGSLGLSQIKKVLHHLTHYGPQHADITLLNRNTGLTIDRHMKWDRQEGLSWADWLESRRFNA